MDSGPFLAVGTSLWSEECNLALLGIEGKEIFYDLFKVPELTLSLQKRFKGNISIIF